MSFSHDQLHSLIKPFVPECNGRISFVRIVTGKFNTSFWVRAGEEEMVLRIAPPPDAVYVFYEREMMRQEPELHALLRDRTQVPVADIIVFDDSHKSLRRDFMLMERLPGRPLTEMPDVNHDHVLGQVGEYLAQTHRLQARHYGYLGVHRPMVPQSKWVDAFEIMWHKMIDDINSVGHYDDQDDRMLRGLLEEHLDAFDRPVAACLLHMDIWHQNILVDEHGEVTGIVDWDRALWGDPEIEFAVLDYCGISKPAFWEGYGRQRDLSPEARTRQVFYLLYELQKYIVIRQGRHEDRAGALRYKRQVMEVIRQYL